MASPRRHSGRFLTRLGVVAVVGSFLLLVGLAMAMVDAVYAWPRM